MDIFGLFWFILAIMFFPFGYKPIIALLSVSSIFQASKLVTLFGINIPVFFCLEIFCILRLLIPVKSSPLIDFNSKIFILIFYFISLMIFITIISTGIFNEVMVYSANNSFEKNYFSGGVKLEFGSSNINQMLLISTHLTLLFLFYKRRNEITKEFYLKTIVYSTVIFIIFSVIWFIFPSYYSDIMPFILNNDQYSINSLYENRLSGTFSEPSFAGLFIGSISIPLIFSKIKEYSLIGTILLLFGLLNLSGTFLSTIAISLFLLLFFVKNLRFRTFLMSIGFLVITSIVIYFSDSIYNLISVKDSSISGIVRGDSNNNAINVIFETYFLGAGVGSLRVSSQILNILSNFGVFLSIYLFYILYKTLSLNNSKSSSVLIIMLIICFVGSWSAIPDYTLSLLWNLVFANTVCGNLYRNNIKDSKGSY